MAYCSLALLLPPITLTLYIMIGGHTRDTRSSMSIDCHGLDRTVPLRLPGVGVPHLPSLS